MTAEDNRESRALEDAALVQRAQAGEPGAFDEIFLRYRGQVYSLAYRMTGNCPEAEDLCQEIFLLTFRKLDSFKGRSSFSTWLYRVAMNRLRDHGRRTRRKREFLTIDDKELDNAGQDAARPQSNGEPEENAIREEANRLIQDAILKLPLSLRAPLVLHGLEGLQYQEVASLLHLPVGTVKSRIYRARIRLADMLAEHKEQWG